MHSSFPFTFSAPAAYPSQDPDSSGMDTLDLYTRSSSPDPFYDWFDLDRWAADNGVARSSSDIASDAPDASNAYAYSYEDMANAYYASQDALAPPFDAFAPSVTSTSEACGWDSRDHVTLGPDGPEPFPYPFVNPGDICDVVPFFPPSASQLGDDDEDDEDDDVEALEPEEPVAEEEPDSDDSLAQVDAWLASLSAEPVAIVEEPVIEPEILLKPSAPRSCKRKRPDHNDADIFPTPPKKCARGARRSTPHTPARPSPSSLARSQSPALDKSTIPKAIVVARTEFPCPMRGCGEPLETKDSVWRHHFRRAHHAELCSESACAVSGSCERRCPLPKENGSPCDSKCMTVDSLGRHVLNSHLGVQYRCPVCGEQRQQRQYAADRHVRMCFKKSLEAGRA
ncbi:uncharacterized protein TRAVEDRAFT_74757 [Trametes versicolor FP-101664 SS1]|uniref:uncharacterized protein n=1 Tax=Trametes versicolor (strain FP-101664) TaxID=717944 RepID=UPI0004623F5B|nr:uncharacterized protein TRAVEDRAFT_74757 [Trametes versicolor FP-101664 SS1]EIW53429.1 hypothetical protein TRAVEDRAFT_74757 [Trametes versicolor FP-101664 SS1]